MISLQPRDAFLLISLKEGWKCPVLLKLKEDPKGVKKVYWRSECKQQTHLEQVFVSYPQVRDQSVNDEHSVNKFLPARELRYQVRARAIVM